MREKINKIHVLETSKIKNKPVDDVAFELQINMNGSTSDDTMTRSSYVGAEGRRLGCVREKSPINIIRTRRN